MEEFDNLGYVKTVLRTSFPDADEGILAEVLAKLTSSSRVVGVWKPASEVLPEPGYEVLGADDIAPGADAPDYCIYAHLYYFKEGTVLRVEGDPNLEMSIEYPGQAQKTLEERLYDNIFGLGRDELQEITEAGWYVLDDVNDAHVMQFRKLVAPKYWMYPIDPDGTELYDQAPIFNPNNSI